MPGSSQIWLKVPEKLISGIKPIISTRYLALNQTKCPFTGEINRKSSDIFLTLYFREVVEPVIYEVLDGYSCTIFVLVVNANQCVYGDLKHFFREKNITISFYT